MSEGLKSPVEKQKTKGRLSKAFDIILTALVVVVGMRMLGVMLISSIIIFPAMTAMWLCQSFRWTVISAGIIGVVSFVIGMYLSYVNNISAGAAIVLVNLFLFVGFYALGKLRRD